ncbi:hypothetical protein KPH14_012689 [Odynerus spinipes]|uniref:Uncharacterized protein n=1 Tax=Odynerus spinipes TaxID=1348599 RepID=A0AAD9VKA6_9HYME|nr:hypothetical protein KPH14_012689 [Odynerus spinipes]
MSLYHLMDEQTLNKIAESTMGKIWDGFLTFGSISAGIIMIFFIIQLIKTIADAVIHGVALHSVYGCSMYIFAALWGSLANLLLRQGSHKQEPARETREPRSKEEPDTRVPTPSPLEEVTPLPGNPVEPIYDDVANLAQNHTSKLFFIKPSEPDLPQPN